MINIYFSYKNQASIPIMALFLISVLGFVAFLYTAPRETVPYRLFSFNLLLFPF